MLYVFLVLVKPLSFAIMKLQVSQFSNPVMSFNTLKKCEDKKEEYFRGPFKRTIIRNSWNPLISYPTKWSISAYV